MKKEAFVVFLETEIGKGDSLYHDAIGRFDCFVNGLRWNGEIYSNRKDAKKVYDALKGIDGSLKIKKVTIESI